jgi:streptomycin 6-kinase
VRLAPAADLSSFPVPSLLAEYVASLADPVRTRWLDDMPQLVASIAERWGLTFDGPYQPGGHCSWVAPAYTRAGERLVLKVGWEHPEAIAEASGLRLWDGNGAVRLHAAEKLADSAVLLLERCEPGTQLSSVPEPEQDEVIAGIMRRLWREPPAGHEFPVLQAMCDDWADRFEADADRPRLLDPGIERAGIELFRTLPATADRQVVIATDLHAENVLAAEREPWLAVDPKPHIGDPTYDPLQHMLNCDRLGTDPVGLTRRMAGLLDLDADRLQLWLFARCVVQDTSEWPELADVAIRLAP